MAKRVQVISKHLVQKPASSPSALDVEELPVALPEKPLGRPFAGFQSPTGRVYPNGTLPSLMGNLEPVAEELSGPLVLIHGALPTALDGQFIRNGPNPARPQEGNPGYHEFEGDGMLHSVDLKAGMGVYTNRYIETKRKTLEQEKNRAMKRGEKMEADGTVRGCGNTALVYHAKRLLALYEVDKPYIISSTHLETLGQLTYEDNLKHSMTAHPKVCPVTGELVFFGYDMMQPIVHYAVADKSGKLLRSFDVPTQGGKPVMMHDLAITTNYSLLLEFPLYFHLDRAMKGMQPYVHDASMPSQFGILPRHAKSADEVRWFIAETGMAFHIVNAWEEGDTIKLVGCRQAYFSFEYGDSCPSLLHEWTFDLKTGATTERGLDDTHIEFPVLHPDLVGKKNRYAWAAAFAGTGLPFHSIFGVMKYDMKTGEKLQHDFLGGRWGGESVFVPCGDSEDSGYLLTYTYNPEDHSTELYVVDAKTMDPDPVAILRTPQRVPFGFHGLWVPRTDE